jgi:ribonuclease III
MSTAYTDYQSLETLVGYHFDNIDLLAEALRHSSFVNEQIDDELHDNERMEFLGDAVLSLVIGHLLMRDYPHLHEGELSRIRANMVNETQLADLSRMISLGQFLQLGKGELQSNGRDKNSILANAFEALIAAVYLDKGFGAAFDFIESRFKPLLSDESHVLSGQNYKSRLQEKLQSNGNGPPVYKVIEETGPDHEKTFHVAMQFGDLQAQGQGKSKKAAEQEAARSALEMLDRMDKES